MREFTGQASVGIAVLAMILVATVFGCADDPTGYDLYGDYPCLTPGPEIGDRSLQDDPSYPWTLNDEFAALAREVPGGFAGVFYDPHHVLTNESGMIFYLTDLSQEDAAIAALRQHGYPAEHAVQGDYDWLQLYSCYRAFRWTEDPGYTLTMSDIDEFQNRLVYGITDLADESAFRAAIRASEIPQGMVIVEESQPLAPLGGD